ncbi:hydrolases or acyltransferases (alpha/beta hydrolase superfamily) [Fusarium bulbicola]|nr:hydrolases or acyltransferases (alpha/beta hydrolase superfamily) [Fusarium bulbicola]
MHRLHEALQFHYETMRALGTTPYRGADLTEVLNILPNIKAGDFDSWYNEWFALAKRVLATVDETKEDQFSTATLRDVYFRVSHYIFVAEFFLHGNKKDPRIEEAFQLYKKYFNKANALLPIPGEHHSVKMEGGFDIPLLVYRADCASASSHRPTLIVGGGFESVMEETYHIFARAALERGYNVVLYKGPGHRCLVRQGRGFIAEWEKAVSPVVDFIINQSGSGGLRFINTAKLGLIGMSMGGYLAARAAAFEPRLQAVLLVDGVYSMLECFLGFFPFLKEPWESGDKVAFDKAWEANPESWSSTRRWIHDDLLYTFDTDSGYEAFRESAKMTLKNRVAQRIKMPAWVGDAADDMFFEGPPQKVASEIGSHATLVKFGPDLGGQLHCQSGAFLYLNQTMLEWWAEIVGY